MLSLASLAWLLAISTSGAPDSTQASGSDTVAYSEVVVGRGQTASWVALRELGHWSPETRTRIGQDNPLVSLDGDLQGKRLRLRRSMDQRHLEPARKLELGIRKAVVVRVQGKVERTLPSGQWAALSANDFLPIGTRIRTGGGSSAELVIDNQSIFRLRENTRLTLEAIQDSSLPGKPSTQVALEEGSVWTKVRRWAGSLVQYRVRMPNGIAGVHGTIFECSILPDGKGRVDVLEGQVGVTGAASGLETLVAEGNGTAIDSRGIVGPVEPLAPKAPSSPEIFDESGARNLENQRMAMVQWKEKHSFRDLGKHPRY